MSPENSQNLWATAYESPLHEYRELDVPRGSGSMCSLHEVDNSTQFCVLLLAMLAAAQRLARLRIDVPPL